MWPAWPFPWRDVGGELCCRRSAVTRRQATVVRSTAVWAQWSVLVNVSMKRARRYINTLWHETLWEGGLEGKVATIGQKGKHAKNFVGDDTHRYLLRISALGVESNPSNNKPPLHLPVWYSLFIRARWELSPYLSWLSAVRQEVFEKTTTRLSVRNGWHQILLDPCERKSEKLSGSRYLGLYPQLYINY